MVFSPSLIEVRNPITGELTQLIQGEEINLTYDGTGISKSHISDVENSLEISEKRIQFSMKAGDYYKIFGLWPTTYLRDSRVLAKLDGLVPNDGFRPA